MVEINSNTNLLAIIGNPLKHSLSPFMQNTFIKSLGINYVYLPLEVEKEKVKEALEGLWTLGFKGINVTIPFKEKVIPYLTGLSPEAKLIGAVNTLIRQNNGFFGDNTDGKGFLSSLMENNVKLKNKKVIILGAGGSAKAVAVSTALAGASRLVLINRNIKKANDICNIVLKELGVLSSAYTWDEPELDKIISEGDLIVNTTPLGMFPKTNEMVLLNSKWLRPDQVVVDLIYNPLETKFLREARLRGCLTINGLGMLIHQGALSLKLWTGLEPNITSIREKLEIYLKKD